MVEKGGERMKKLILVSTMVIFLTCILLLTIPTQSYADSKIQFENYKWGSSIDEVEGIILSGGFGARRLTGCVPTTSYLNKVFDEKAYIRFFFTPKTKKLHMINVEWNNELEWENIYLANSILKTLTEKYGRPRDLSKSKEGHVWLGENAELRLIISGFETRLIYCSLLW